MEDEPAACQACGGAADDQRLGGVGVHHVKGERGLRDLQHQIHDSGNDAEDAAQSGLLVHGGGFVAEREHMRFHACFFQRGAEFAVLKQSDLAVGGACGGDVEQHELRAAEASGLIEEEHLGNGAGGFPACAPHLTKDAAGQAEHAANEACAQIFHVHQSSGDARLRELQGDIQQCDESGHQAEAQQHLAQRAEGQPHREAENGKGTHVQQEVEIVHLLRKTLRQEGEAWATDRGLERQPQTCAKENQEEDACGTFHRVHSGCHPAWR